MNITETTSTWILMKPQEHQPQEHQPQEHEWNHGNKVIIGSQYDKIFSLLYNSRMYLFHWGQAYSVRLHQEGEPSPPPSPNALPPPPWPNRRFYHKPTMFISWYFFTLLFITLIYLQLKMENHAELLTL